MKVIWSFLILICIGVTAVQAQVPDISVNQTFFDYGDVFVGQSQDRAFAVSNDGTASLTIFATSIQGANAADFRIVSGGGPRIVGIGGGFLINVRFEPTSLGAKNATLRLESDDPDENPLDITVTGNAEGLPDIAVSPNTLAFGDVRVNTTQQRELIVSNTGLADLNVTSVNFIGPNSVLFSLAENILPFSVSPNERDTIRVNFLPTSGGNKSGTMVVGSDDPDLNENPVNIPLTGRGVRPEIAVDVSNHDFGGVAVGSNDSFTITVSNEGTGPLRILSTEILGIDLADFQVTGGGGLSTINPAAQRLITVRFTPQMLGVRNAFLRIANDDEDENPVDIPLTGIGLGLPNIVTSASFLAFGDTRVDTANRRELIVTNTGLASLEVTSASVTGIDTNMFEVVDTELPFLLAPLERDTIRVQFRPTSSGDKSASLLIANTDPDTSPVNILLTGRGVRPDIASDVSELSFGSVAVGLNEIRTVELSNEGLGPLRIESTTVIGTDAVDFQITSGGGSFTINPSATRSVSVRFAPGTLGSKIATLQIVSDDPDENPLDIALSGSGGGLAEIALSRTVIAFNNVRVGTSRTEEFIVVNAGLADLEVSLSEITGPDAPLFSVETGSLPLKLVPEARDTVRVVFSPLSGGNKSATLILATNDPDENPTEVFLSGQGVRPELAVDMTDIDFGNVAVGTEETLAVVLANLGTGNLIVFETTLLGSDADQFAISAGGGTFTVGPGNDRTISIDFTPADVGIKSASLRILSDDLSIPELNIELAGNGSAISVTVPPTISEGQEISILGSFPLGFQADNANVFYRLGGEPTYRSAVSTLIGNAIQATIPGSAATLSGIEYYIVASNNLETITLPIEDPQTNPLFLPVRISELEAPITLSSWIFSMISVPLILDDPSVSSVLGDDYGTTNTRRWRLFHWVDGEYQEWPEFERKFEPGVGFFLVTNDGSVFDVEDGQSVDPASPLSITLVPGWNQIGNPYAYPISWPSDLIDPGIEDPVAFRNTSGVNDVPFFEFVSGQSTLFPWEGYFVYNSGTVPVTIPLSTRGLAKGNPVANSSSDPIFSNGDFVLQLVVRTNDGRFRDSQNFIGFKHGSEIGYDDFDYSEAPALEHTLKLSIVENGGQFAGNFKPYSDAGHSWDLHLSGAASQDESTIQFKSRGALPEGFATYLIDVDNRSGLPIADGLARIPASNLDNVRHLRLIVGTNSFAETSAEDIPLVPVLFDLGQNYPNPFNPETLIRYQIPEQAFVHLEIFDVAGRSIRTLVQEVQSAGSHEVGWDGKSDLGSSVASGMYIYRLRSGSHQQSNKMLLVR